MSDLLAIDEANRKAALALDSFIVEAPAGAGKTELLTQRYLKLLCQVEAPEEIIAITFTNKAAAEMRSRILDSLQAAAAQAKPDKPHKQVTYDLSLQALQHAQTHDWQLMQNPARLRIFTIDGLCAHLARQMPLMSRFGAQPKVSDDAQLLYTQAAEQALALIDDNTHGATVQAALRYFDNDLLSLQSLIASMLEKRDQWLQLAQAEVNIAAMQNTLAQLVSQDLQQALHALPNAYQQLLMPIARYAASNLAATNAQNHIAALLDWQDFLSAKLADLPAWCALANLLLTNDGTPRKAAGLNIKFGFPPNDEGKAQKQALVEVLNLIETPAALHAVRSLPNSQDDASWAMIAALSRLLSMATAQLWLIFQANGEVDFTEIAQRAQQALQDDGGAPTDLALKLDYKISHLLVDEFQDTSPSQIALLESLTAGWQTGDGRTLFCVGDPMQSIYRFRKANVRLFIDAAKHGIGALKLRRLQLYRNNRASPALVDWINTSFKPMFALVDDADAGAISFRASSADPSKHAPESGVKVHALLKAESLEETHIEEADKIIEIILQQDVQNKATNTTRKIAVLVSAKRHLTALVTQLRRKAPQIKFQAVEIEALQNRQVVQDLLALALALHHRADRVNWLAVLRAPWCGLRLEDLHKLAGEHHQATIWSLMGNAEIVAQLSPDAQTRLQHVRTIFEEAFNTQGRMPISQWLRGIWLKLGGANCLWEPADVVDVQAFFSCLDQLEQHNEFTLERMLTEVDKLFAAPDSEGEQVQLMTIHKSKGLEFDTVILPSLGAQSGGNNDNKPLILWEEIINKHQPTLLAAAYLPKGARSEAISAYDYLEARENTRDAHEQVRRLYVAATRAERTLHLIGSANHKKDEIYPPKNSALALLWPALSAEFALATPSNGSTNHETNNQTIAQFIPQLIRLKAPQNTLAQVLNAQFLNAPNAQQAAYTASTTHPPESQLTADMGILAHRYLQTIAQQGLAAWPPARLNQLQPAMQQWLRQRGHAQTDVATSKVIQALQTTLQSTQGQWILQNHQDAQNEYALISADGAHHIIDRTFIENNTRWIIDYKLGLEISAENAQTAALSHQAQLARYASLFAAERLAIKQAVFFLNIGQLVMVE